MNLKESASIPSEKPVRLVIEGMIPDMYQIASDFRAECPVSQSTIFYTDFDENSLPFDTDLRTITKMIKEGIRGSGATLVYFGVTISFELPIRSVELENNGRHGLQIQVGYEIINDPDRGYYFVEI